MNETTKQAPGSAGYEYTEVTTRRRLESVYTDSYPSFGWQLIGQCPPPKGSAFVELHFRRERRLRNKLELSRLQRQFDTGLDEIRSLEQSKRFRAAAAACLVGVAGTAFMTGAVFCVLTSRILTGVILAIPGIAGTIAPYFLYRAINKRQTTKVKPLIDQKYHELYAIRERAGCLLQTG